jgi:hypothetical protein
LRHTRRVGVGQATSRGRGVTAPFTELDGVRHDGHAATTVSAVGRYTTRHLVHIELDPIDHTPSNPQRRRIVVYARALLDPVALATVMLIKSREHLLARRTLESDHRASQASRSRRLKIDDSH